ncbi:restriction endonuclease subunit S [Bacteroides thetaiotaomicron]|uniref:restriction endonuclease subunit S n=2 Tax=Bacteroides TaxID=816 RepID=UPI00201E4DA8|nr:restriction endonuclease subunit S [Bacteroides thetaiotaomicron]
MTSIPIKNNDYTDNNENKVLNVPHLRFPEFSGEWETKSINDLADVIGGGTPDTTVKSYWDGGIQWFTPSEIGKNKFVDASLRTITEDGLNNSSAKLLPPNTILLSSRATIGECSLSLRECATNQGFQSLVSKNCNVDFLYYLIQTKKKDLIRKSCGSTFLEISANEVRKIQVSVPSDVEQQKIAELLSLIDKRIATQNKIIEKYESLIKGLNNILLYATGGKSVCLGDILLERSERSRTNNQHEVLSSTVKGIFSQREYFSKDIASENNVGYKIIRLHDVVLSPQNLWMGNINYNDRFEIGIVSPSYKVFSIADGYDNQFVAAMLKTHRALYSYMMVSEQGASIVRRNLNMEAFSQLVFKIPSLDKQREIGCAISLLKSQLKTANKIIRAYTSQKQYLLCQMFI